MLFKKNTKKPLLEDSLIEIQPKKNITVKFDNEDE